MNTNSTTNSINQELQAFIQSMKKDQTQYEVLKDDKQFDNWERSFLAVARTHKLDEVFNEAFQPGTTQEEQDLWQEKQRFVYSVFDLTLKTDYGKHL
jgi:hypothetical protein